MILTGLKHQSTELWQKKEVYEFFDVLTSNWFAPKILEPTRFAEHNKPSLVDNIIFNFSDMHCIYK